VCRAKNVDPADAHTSKAIREEDILPTNVTIVTFFGISPLLARPTNAMR
jgi:hypothetical protein